MQLITPSLHRYEPRDIRIFVVGQYSVKSGFSPLRTVFVPDTDVDDENYLVTLLLQQVISTKTTTLPSDLNLVSRNLKFILFMSTKVS